VGIFKRATGLAAAFAVLGTLAVADETPRFQSKDVLESLDLFANQQATLDSTAPDSDSDFKVDFSFRGSAAAPEPGFLYLQDTDPASAPVGQDGIPPAVGFTPRLSALDGVDSAFNARGESRSLSSFTPRYAGADLTISYDPDGNPSTVNSFGLGISSEMMIGSANPALRPLAERLGNYAIGPGPFDRQSINIGISLDYSGFRMGAAVTREAGGFETGYRGLDVGLGYAWNAFTTEFSIGEYDVIDSDLALVGLDRDFTRLELGAAYAVSERLRFSGGVRLFDYSRRFGLDAGQADRSGVLYLGTRLNF